jgi:hypothetical protein
MFSFVQNMSFCWVYCFISSFRKPSLISWWVLWTPSFNVLSFHTCVRMKHLTSVTWHSRTNKAPTCCRKCKHSLLCDAGVLHVSEETLVECKARIAQSTYYARWRTIHWVRSPSLISMVVTQMYFVQAGPWGSPEYLGANIWFVAKLNVVWQ